jgi:DNA-binding NarL/FixJ family response regulator
MSLRRKQRRQIVALASKDSKGLAARVLAEGASGLALTSDPVVDLVLTEQSVGMSKPLLSPAAVTMIRSQLAQPQASGPKLNDLTPRELEILESLAKGRTDREVAAALSISVKTVNVHRANIMWKLELRNYSDVIRFAIRNNLIET